MVDEVSRLVDRAIKSISSSNIINNTKSFISLNDSLISSGKVNASNIKPNGMVKEKTWKGKDNNNSRLEKAIDNSVLYDSSVALAPSLKQSKPIVKKTLGKGWFDMEPMKLDENLKRDIKLIQMRNSLDPKRFYKKADKIKNVLHVGTIVEGSSEYKSSRINKRDRKQTITDEILADQQIMNYSKRKYNELQEKNSSFRKVYKGIIIIIIIILYPLLLLLLI